MWFWPKNLELPWTSLGDGQAFAFRGLSFNLDAETAMADFVVNCGLLRASYSPETDSRIVTVFGMIPSIQTPAS